MEKTLIILGAGASKDLSWVFPTGLELIKEINYHFLTENKFPPPTKEADGVYLSPLMNDIVRVMGNDIKLFSEIKNLLWNAQLDFEYKVLRNDKNHSISIDNFIASRINEGKLDPRSENIIKYSIYYLIKGAEQAFAEGNYDKKANWIVGFAKKISKYDIKTIIENLTVITFNYDRTFKKIFIESLDSYISINKHEALLLQNSIKHVYGSLGSLDEIFFELPNKEVDILKDKYHQIKLIDGRQKIELDPNIYKKIHLIGFGYDETNMEVINLSQFKSALIRGTAYEFSNEKREDLWTAHKIETRDISCKGYISDIFI